MKTATEINIYGHSVTPELVFEISDLNLSVVGLFKLQDEVRKVYGERWRFDHTEPKYEDCIMAHFVCD